MKFYFLALISLCLVACTTTSSVEADKNKSKLSEKCSIVPNKMLEGQIRYFKNMNLKMPSCHYFGTISFGPNPEEGIRRVISELNMDPTSPEYHDFQYVDIKFYGSTNSDGELTITRVVDAKRTRESIFK